MMRRTLSIALITLLAVPAFAAELVISHDVNRRDVAITAFQVARAPHLLSSEDAASGHVLTADGVGGVSFQAITGLVTGGDGHDHSGGDGGQIAYGSLSGTPTLYNQTIQDEGSPVTQRSTVDFVGAGVSVADAGGKTTVTIAGGGGLADGDKGDISVSGSGSTWTIDNGVVSLGKLADMATDSFLGRDTAGTGAPEVLSTSSTKTLLDLSGTNSGDVTLAGALDYLTITGQQITRGAIDLTTDVTGDLPFSNVAQASAASRLLGRGSASGAGDLQEITLGSGLSMSGTTLSASASGDGLGTDGDKGDVTVGGTGTTLTIDAGAVSYAKLQDVSAASKLLGRGSAAGSGDAEEITLGTGLSMSGTTLNAHAQSHAITSTSDHSANNWKVWYSNGSGQVTELALGSSGTYLQSNGASSAPSFVSVATNPWTMVVATDDQLVTNSAVLADSTYLQFTTTANTNYHIRLRVLFNSGNASADIKYRVTHGGTTTRVRRVRTYSIPNGTSATFPTVLPATAFDSSDQTLLATVTGDAVVYEDIYLQVGASGGTFKIAFAQNTQTGSASVTLYEGSYLEYQGT